MVIQLHIVTIIHESNAWRHERESLVNKQLHGHCGGLDAPCIPSLQSKICGGNAVVVNETEDGGV